MSVRESRLSVLVLGCGQAATIHSRTWRRIGGVELSYASRDRERARKFCQDWGGRAAFGSYDEGLSDESVDVVLIATPTVTHRDLTLRALAAGKHAIVEKPAFMCSRDADVVCRAASAVGRRVFVAENYVYKPIAAHLRGVIRAGDLGDVRFVTLNATKHQRAEGWRAEPALSGGGALFEGGVHWVSFAAHIGLEVSDVYGQQVGNMDGADRSALVVFRYANGAAGTLAYSWELDAPFGGLRLSKVQGTLGAVTFESNGFAAVTTGSRRSIRVLLRDTLGYRAMLEDFRRAIRTGEAPAFTLAMAQQDLRRLEQLRVCFGSA